MNNPALNIGIIGLGHWGPNHLRVFNSLPDSRVAAVADKEAARLERARAVAPGARGYGDHSALLADPEVQAVVVATPTATHHRLVRDALLADKHVFCEKPLCLRSDEGAELVALARTRGRILMVGHVFLFNAGLVKVKELLATGEIGEPRCLTAIRTNLGPIRSDVNAAYDLASHDIAICNWLLGAEPVAVQAMGAAFLQPGIEDVVAINLKYPGNILASIQSSWLDPKKVRQLTLVGSKKMVTWDDLALSNPVAIYEKSVETKTETNSYGEFLRLSMRDGDVRLPKVETEEPLKAQAREFLAAIREKRTPVSDGAFANQVVKVLEQVQADLRA